jgi:hypothetical protein
MRNLNTLFITCGFLSIHFFAPMNAAPLKDTSTLKYNFYKMSADLRLAPNYYTTKTGFFCNTERSLEKYTKLPVKFRLGSVEQTQKLEGYHLSRNEH